MTFIEALEYIIKSVRTAADVPVLIITNLEAAEILSAYINMEGGSGNIKGKFHTADIPEFWEVEFKQLQDSNDLTELAADS